MQQALLAINGSPAANSRTHAVAAVGIELAGGGRLVDLAELDAEALLGRRRDPRVDALLHDLGTAERILLATPVYRATYSGLLKVVLDQLPPDALVGAACVLAATAAGPAHELSLDTGLRPVIASVGGWTVPTTIYATHADFADDGQPLPGIRERLGKALSEAAEVGAGRAATPG